MKVVFLDQDIIYSMKYTTKGHNRGDSMREVKWQLHSSVSLIFFLLLPYFHGDQPHASLSSGVE
jgi:hypothetical protein